MKDDTIDALELLMSQHQEVDSLIEDIEDADDPDEKRELFIQLADMLDLDVDDEHFDAKLTVLKELFRHHAHDEEEGKLFPLVRKLMSRDELAGLGNELLAMYEQLIEHEPRKQVPSETAEAAPLMI